ncbi:PREDICTED: epithelial chloride channel protein-like [Gekko japonicus]|uniref:Epithelial chloride channel protein-like n=1 Tax=Gekko japonicus TaxID=146911 RepID=A0ABM1KEN2_GEKJA|nr:PREDICTED: epithelial chloride channel protein-like [Gekko japonicus]
MMVNIWLLALVLQLLHGVTGSLVKLNNGGFEDIVIAINPQLPEDDKIINSLKEMVKEASTYLFNATEQRFYFKTVKIIVPLTWTSKSEYRRVTIESYEKADVIVADPFLKYGDDPYTLQYGGCGEQGRYIHFTSNFLTNDSLHDVYGSRGRVLVHEWAHLRWGVFDEYNNDAPFYPAGQNRVEATRCSADVTGKYVFSTKDGKTRTCRYDHRTQVYEAGCQFVPDRKQSTPASIMYMQSLSSVIEFCNNNSHNINATNMHNKLCKYRSTWEVIASSKDFASSSPLSALPPDPTFSLLQTQDRVLCLVLDVSGSMASYNRINRLKQAAEIFIRQIIETGSWVGIVTFNSAATIRTDLQHITSDSVRDSLVCVLPTSAGGGTKICSGVQKGFQVFLQKYKSTEGCEIILLTDGEDSTVSSCFGAVEQSGSIIHTIALGPSAAEELEMLANKTGGLRFSATDNLDSNSLIEAFTGISSRDGNISQQAIQLESKGQNIKPMDWLDGTVSIDKTVGNDTYFIVTWSVSVYPPGIFLTDPKGRKYRQTDFVIDNTNLHMARLKINGTAEAGDWSYAIQSTHTAGAQVISMTVTTRAASLTVPPVTVKSYLNKDTNNYPNPMIIYAEVSQGFLPVIGANVTATVEPASGTVVELELYDTGSGADILKHDGIYSRYFTSFNGDGRYNIKIRVQGKDKTVRRVRRYSQALYVPGYVENGVIKMNMPRPEVSEDEIQPDIGNFSRIASGGSFVLAGAPPSGSSPPPDVFPPCKITDLEAQLEDDEFLLSWTAPGNDYDIGKVERYEIKMSKNPLELRDATFHTAISVNTSGLTTEFAGIKQSFQFKPENFTKENGTTIYFAIRGIDDSNNVGEASNIARTVVLVSTFPTTLPKNNNSIINTTTIIVIIVCASVVVICAIISITICVLKRKPRNPASAMLFFLKTVQTIHAVTRFVRSILLNPVVKERISADVKNFFKENETEGMSPALLWDCMKAVIRGALIAASSRIRRDRERERTERLERIARLEKEHKAKGSIKVLRQLNAERKLLDALETSQIQKNLMYLKQKFWLKSPKNVQILAWRVKSKRKSNLVGSVLDNKGAKQYAAKDIAQTFADFYAVLYKSRLPNPGEVGRYLNADTSIPTLAHQHVDLLEEQISPLELKETIKGLKNNKVTGPDGLPSEFYKTFQEPLLDHLLKVCNGVLLQGVLPRSWAESIITVIHKENKDPTSPSSYRPIALLNHDNKIFTTILANRLKTFISNYINPDQTGFIPGRQITDNIRRTLEIIIHRKKIQEEALILALDFEKAFDSVEPLYIVSLFKKMGFGGNFLRAIQAIYSSNTARIRKPYLNFGTDLNWVVDIITLSPTFKSFCCPCYNKELQAVKLQR